MYIVYWTLRTLNNNIYRDKMESFFLGETLKYLPLMMSLMNGWLIIQRHTRCQYEQVITSYKPYFHNVNITKSLSKLILMQRNYYQN